MSRDRRGMVSSGIFFIRAIKPFPEPPTSIQWTFPDILLARKNDMSPLRPITGGWSIWNNHNCLSLIRIHLLYQQGQLSLKHRALGWKGGYLDKTRILLGRKEKLNVGWAYKQLSFPIWELHCWNQEMSPMVQGSEEQKQQLRNKNRKIILACFRWYPSFLRESASLTNLQSS